MGAAAPAVAQWIPLHGICHDFVHAWQWREVVRTKKALRSLSDLRTPPWHFLNVELVVLFKEVLLRNPPWQRLHIAMKANHISAINQMQMLASLARSEFRRPSVYMQKTRILCVKLKRIVHHSQVMTDGEAHFHGSHGDKARDGHDVGSAEKSILFGIARNIYSFF
jgi:hypothetical protein